MEENKVKSYSADDIKQTPKQLKTSAKKSSTKVGAKKQSETARPRNILKKTDKESTNSVTSETPTKTDDNVPTKNNKGAETIYMFGQKGTVFQKLTILFTFFIGLSSILFFLNNWFLLIGLIAIVVPLLFFILQKVPATKNASRKTFFVNLGGAILSMLFWVLYLSTRRLGIGFLSATFRGLQIISAVLSAGLVLYFLLSFITNGKTELRFIENITEKTEEKMNSMK